MVAALLAWLAGAQAPASCCRCLRPHVARTIATHDGWLCSKCYHAGLWLKP